MRSIDEVKISEKILDGEATFEDVINFDNVLDQLDKNKIILSDDEIYALIHYIYVMKNHIQDIFILTNLLIKKFETTKDLAIALIAMDDLDFIKDICFRYLEYRRSNFMSIVDKVLENK